jgi:hypothetical protein
MINRLGPVADAEAVDQRGRLLIAGYAVKCVSASLSPRDRRESARAVPRGAHRARSALSASTRESGAAARVARETPGVLGRNGEAPSDRSLGASVYRPSPKVRDEREMAPHGVASTKPIGFTRRERAGVFARPERGFPESPETGCAGRAGIGRGSGAVNGARAGRGPFGQIPRNPSERPSEAWGARRRPPPGRPRSPVSRRKRRPGPREQLADKARPCAPSAKQRRSKALVGAQEGQRRGRGDS